MSDILLIDADSVIPNIPLMKLSTYHKNKGDNVKLIRVNLPYYPNRKKKIFNAPQADITYCSVVFQGNKAFIKGDNIIFGGTGVDLTTNLPPEVEKCELDYSIYPDNDTSYGFITRGCIRNCPFCIVPKKEGYIHKVANIDDIVRHKKVKFLDNNILAYSGHKEILSELIDKNIKHQFNQGLDIRLVDNENSILLSKLNYINQFIFAFDNWAYRKIIEDKLKLLEWRYDWQFKFFVYVHPNMKLSDTVKRIIWLREHKCLPYLMRDISCWNSEYSKFYIDLAAYCNQPGFFKMMTFEEFTEVRHLNKNRKIESQKLWNENK